MQRCVVDWETEGPRGCGQPAGLPVQVAGGQGLHAAQTVMPGGCQAVPGEHRRQGLGVERGHRTDDRRAAGGQLDHSCGGRLRDNLGRLAGGRVPGVKPANREAVRIGRAQVDVRDMQQSNGFRRVQLTSDKGDLPRSPISAQRRRLGVQENQRTARGVSHE